MHKRAGATAGRSPRPEGGTIAHVADYLRQQIADGMLLPGQRLRQEQVAAETGTSRLPVREALRILEGEGLVWLEPNKGARVTSLDMHELDLVYSTRAAIEPLVIADSMHYISDGQVAEAREIVRSMEQTASPIDFLVLDRDFHLLTYRGCSSQQLLSIVERLWNATQQYRRVFMTSTGPDWREQTDIEHRLLLAAVEARSPELAAHLVATHITRTRVALRSRPELFVHETAPRPVEIDLEVG